MAGVDGEAFVLVDTSVFVYLTRGRARVEELAPYVRDRRIVLLFCTVAELRRGAFTRNYNEQSWRRMEADVAGTLVVAPDDQLSREWAKLTSEARGMGHALGQSAQAHDAWIAAAARLFDVPVLTEDSDFEGFPGLGSAPRTLGQRSSLTH